jgi:hypothetical protein
MTFKVKRKVPGSAPFRLCWYQACGSGVSADLTFDQRLGVETVHPRNVVERDAFRTGRLARPGIGTITKTLLIHFGDHVEDAPILFYPALRQQAEMRDLCRYKQHRRGILTGRHTSPAADAGRSVKGAISVVLRNWNGVSIWRPTGRDGDISTGLDNTVKGRTIDDKISQYREGGRPPRFNRDRVSIPERAHMELAGRGLQWPVRRPVDHQ